MKFLAKKEKELYRKYKKFYDQKFTLICNEIEKNGAEYSELLKRPTKAEKVRFADTVKAFSGKNPELKQYLQYKIRTMTRWKIMNFCIKIHMLHISVQEQKIIDEHFVRLANRYGTGLTNEEINAMLRKKWIGRITYRERLTRNNLKLAKTLNKELKNCLIRGDDIDKIKKTVRERLDIGARQTRRLVYTEDTHVMNESMALKLEKIHDKYEIVSVLDKNTCATCVEQSGKVYSFKNRKPGVNFPPFHPSCRCTIYAIKS